MDSHNTGDSKVAARVVVVPAGPVTVTVFRMTDTVTEVLCSAVLNSFPAAQWPVLFSLRSQDIMELIPFPNLVYLIPVSVKRIIQVLVLY